MTAKEAIEQIRAAGRQAFDPGAVVAWVLAEYDANPEPDPLPRCPECGDLWELRHLSHCSQSSTSRGAAQDQDRVASGELK